jgi:hypothetical protein
MRVLSALLLVGNIGTSTPSSCAVGVTGPGLGRISSDSHTALSLRFGNSLNCHSEWMYVPAVEGACKHGHAVKTGEVCVCGGND